MIDKQRLKEELLLAENLSDVAVQIIHQEKWLRIWVPKKFKGLEYSLTEGLSLLQQLAEIDGSLAWLVTLCSGSNYFARNLKPEIASTIFEEEQVCFGGSGMIGGTAEKIGNQYLIKGLWHYATGAPMLSHFTLNAQLVENGQGLTNASGEPVFLSFVLEASQVNILPTWKTMGMITTASHSFEVKNQFIHEDYSFVYNQFYSDDLLDRLPFQVFADLTLLVNYLGMAQHFLDLSLAITTNTLQNTLHDFIQKSNEDVMLLAKEVEEELSKNQGLELALINKVHQAGETIVADLIRYISVLYPTLGIKAAMLDEEINQVFRDFFTATQHKNFRRK